LYGKWLSRTIRSRIDVDRIAETRPGFGAGGRVQPKRY